MQIKASSWKFKRKSNVQTVGNGSGTEKEKNSHYEEIFASVLVCEILTNGPFEVAIRALVRLSAMWAREDEQGRPKCHFVEGSAS